LTAVVNDDGPYQLQFDNDYNSAFPGNYTPDDFKHIVLAIPFSTMRESFSEDGDPLFSGNYVDISKAKFSALKRYAIQQLNMSQTSKMNMQFLDRFWNNIGNTGDTYATSNPYVDGQQGVERFWQNTWDVSRAQPGVKGILVDYTGGNYAENFTTSYKTDDILQSNQTIKSEVNNFLNKLDFLLPGANSPSNFAFQYANLVPYQSTPNSATTPSAIPAVSNVFVDNWIQSPWQRGAYSYWTYGQLVGGTGKLNNDGSVTPSGNGPLSAVVPFAGYEGVSEPYNRKQTGNCHFAGEHTAYDNQGYMQGAVESGDRVAAEILGEVQ
jgi:monoamine oxidase